MQQKILSVHYYTKEARSQDGIIPMGTMGAEKNSIFNLLLIKYILKIKIIKNIIDTKRNFC